MTFKNPRPLRAPGDTPFTPVLALLILIAMVLPASGCASIMDMLKAAPKPSISFQNVKVSKLTWQDADMVANFKINNPYGVPIRVGTFDWDLKVSGKNFLSGSNNKGLSAAANKSTSVPLPFKLRFQELLKAVQDAKSKKEVPFELLGKVQINTPLGPVALPLKANGKLPVLQKPKVRLKSLTAKMQGMTKALFEVTMDMDHQNAYGLKLANILYDLKLEGFKVADGNKSMGKAVSQSGTTTVKLPITVDLVGASQALMSTIMTGKVRYELGTDLKLDTPWGVTPLDWNQNGSIRLY